MGWRPDGPSNSLALAVLRHDHLAIGHTVEAFQVNFSVSEGLFNGIPTPGGGRARLLDLTRATGNVRSRAFLSPAHKRTRGSTVLLDPDRATRRIVPHRSTAA